MATVRFGCGGGLRWSAGVRTNLYRHTVGEGALRMPTYAGNSTSAPLVLQPLGDRATWEVTTKVSIDPQVNFQQAGLIARRDDANSVRIDLAHSTDTRIDVVYRFFELFDLKNIPKAELLQYAAKKAQVVVTPPYKPYLEEKLLFALYQHPALAGFWRAELSEETRTALDPLFPRTWVLDPAPLPPQAVYPDLMLGERDFLAAELGEADVGDLVVLIRSDCGAHLSPGLAFQGQLRGSSAPPM